MDVPTNSANKPTLVEKSQAKNSEGTAGVLSAHARNNAPIAAAPSASTFDLSNTDNDTSALAKINNFYSDNKIDANVAI